MFNCLYSLLDLKLNGNIFEIFLHQIPQMIGSKQWNISPTDTFHTFRHTLKFVNNLHKLHIETFVDLLKYCYRIHRFHFKVNKQFMVIQSGLFTLSLRTLLNPITSLHMYIKYLIIYLNTEQPRKAIDFVSECYLHSTRIHIQSVC